jgi:ubiquinone/menaquinone biosynthesis C-methylase UbiE
MHAVDVAPTFVAHASTAEHDEPLGIVYALASATALPFPDERFDFATAFMVFMDLPDHRAAFGDAYRVLRPGGFLQLSILHPCFVPPLRTVLRDAQGRPYAVEVGRYFDAAEGELLR